MSIDIANEKHYTMTNTSTCRAAK